MTKSKYLRTSSSTRFQEGKDSLTKKYQRLRRCLSSHIFFETCTKCASYKERHGHTKTCLILLDPIYHTQAQVLLSKVSRWNFNVFFLENLTNGHALSAILQNLFQDYNFSKTLGIDMFCLVKFAKLAEQGYHESNPYHNSTHATDVVQALHFNIQEEKISKFLKSEEQMAVILAAACHDVDHPGVNQSFLISTHNPLAMLYKNKSVLENHHYRVTKSLLLMTGLLNHMSKEMWNTVDNILRETILATDITLQQDFISEFKRYLAGNTLDLNRDPSSRSFILQIALKCADICNPCRPWPLYYHWSELICEEFFKQGDCEARLGMPVVPPFNRERCDLTAVQTGFIQFIAEPLFIEWDKFAMSKKSKMLLKRLRDNQEQWKTLSISHQKPTFSELYLRRLTSTYKSKKVLDVESKNINKSQNKNINMLIAKNYNRKPMKQNPNEVVSCSSGENSECMDIFYMRRRHSTPAQIARFLSLRGGKDVIAKNISTRTMAEMFTNKQFTKENASKKNASTRRASFPMNVCITHHSKPDCWNEKSSEGFALTGFLSFLYVTAVSKRVCPKDRLASEITWPVGLRGVLGFGPKDRITVLCRHLFQYKAKDFKESKNSLNASGDLSIMTLLAKELFSSTVHP